MTEALQELGGYVTAQTGAHVAKSEIVPLGRQLLELTLEPGIDGSLGAAFAV